VGTERYVLSCHYYIEMNPVHARMITDPLEYRWSSAKGNAGAFDDPLLSPQETYAALASDLAVRRSRYRVLLQEALGQEELASIRANVHQGAAYGSNRFQRRIEELTGRTPRFRTQGRPRKPH
jgi:putative transposase